MSDAPEWISLRHAAEILGVHPATVRNWADKGDLPSRRTPGGHRRFRKSDLIQYAAKQDELQPLEVQVIIQNALGQARLEVTGGMLSEQVWYKAVREEMRNDLRQMGVRTLDAIRNYLALGAQAEQLAGAVQLGRDYAAVLHGEGLSLPQAVRGFFYFSDFVIKSILDWSEITVTHNTPADWSTLLRQVNTFTNTVLLSIIEYYETE